MVPGRGQGHKEQDSNSILQDRSPCHFTAFWHSRGNTLAPDGKQSACWPDSRSIFCSGSSSRARIVLHRPPHWSLYQTLWKKQKQTRATAEWTQVAARLPPCPFMEPTSTQAASAWRPAPRSTAHCPPRRRDLRRCQSSAEGPLLSRTHIPSHRHRPVTDAHRPPSTTSFFDLGQGHGIKVATRRQTWAVCGVCTYRASRSC